MQCIFCTYLLSMMYDNASEVTTLWNYTNMIMIIIIIIIFKIRSITEYYKISWSDLPPHQQSSH